MRGPSCRVLHAGCRACARPPSSSTSPCRSIRARTAPSSSIGGTAIPCDAVAATPRQIAAERGAARVQILHFGAVVGGLVELELLDVGIRQRQAEAVAERLQVVEIELLLLMRRHAALPARAHAEALHRLRENHGRLALVRQRRRVRRVQLAHVVAAAPQAVDVLIGEMRGERGKLGVLAEEALAVVLAVVGREGLELAVDRMRECAQQRARAVAREQRVPVRAPQHLDHVPARAGELRLEFIDDAPVAAHRAVEPLQIAIDDEHEIVELLARGQRQRADRFRLVHLAVAEEAPDLASIGLLQPAILQIAHEARLINRVDRTNAHRAGRKLPEVRHQPRMRIRTQPRPRNLTTIVAADAPRRESLPDKRAHRHRATSAAGNRRGRRRARRRRSHGRNG